MASRNTRTSENVIPGALRGSVTRRSTPGHGDTRRAASSRRRSTLEDDVYVRRIVIGRKTVESTRTQPPNPNSHCDAVDDPVRAIRRAQPSATKYGGKAKGAVNSHIHTERSGRSDFAKRIPAGTPISAQTPVVANANRTLLPSNGQKRA